MFDDNFIAKYVTGGTLHLWKGYILKFDQTDELWFLCKYDWEVVMKGTIDECAAYYTEHNLAAR